MALNTRLSVEARDVQLDALAVLANNGYLRIYNGTQPTDPDTSTSDTLLAELRFAATAFGAAAAGVITAAAITDDSDANATGTAVWFRVLKSDGTSALWDGSCGTSGTNMVLNSTAIQIHAKVSVTTLTHTLPLQGA